MADFCTIDDVKAENPHRVYDATSNPTSTQVTGFITKIASEIRAVIRKHGLDESALVAVQYTADLLNTINAKGAAYMAERAGLSGRSPRLSDHAQQLKDDYDWWIQSIFESPGMLEEASGKGGKVHARWTDTTPRDKSGAVNDEPNEPRITLREKF